MIPRIDRGGTDFSRFPGVICKVSEHGGDVKHQILTIHGILNDQYRTSDLESYSGVLDVNLEDFEIMYDEYPRIGLTECAKLASAAKGSVEDVRAVCNCAGICKGDNRCSCFKKGLKCTSHCHDPKKMKNKAKVCKNCK